MLRSGIPGNGGFGIGNGIGGGNAGSAGGAGAGIGPRLTSGTPGKPEPGMPGIGGGNAGSAGGAGIGIGPMPSGGNAHALTSYTRARSTGASGAAVGWPTVIVAGSFCSPPALTRA
jgi:hypothetical protein